MIASERRLALIREFEAAARPDRAPADRRAVSTCDWVLVEGFKHADLLKIEVWRAATGKPAQYPNDAFVVAIATDSARARCRSRPACRCST